jgi:CarD family transcriptional regulator
VLPLMDSDDGARGLSFKGALGAPAGRVRRRFGLSFRVGDKVVYPHHGAAVIEKVEERELLGEMREYYILKLAYGELTLMVPTDSTDEVGLRDVTPAREVPKVFKVLKKNEPTTNTTNWSRRFKANVEKLKSGDIYQVADVVRSLHQRDKEKGLSAGEKRMLTKARQILVSELTFSKDCNEEEAEEMLDEVLG